MKQLVQLGLFVMGVACAAEQGFLRDKLLRNAMTSFTESERPIGNRAQEGSFGFPLAAAKRHLTHWDTVWMFHLDGAILYLQTTVL